MTYAFGWRPDTPDIRDRYLKIPRFSFATMSRPRRVDLRYMMPDVYDQGTLGSCTAQAIAAMVEAHRMKHKKAVFTPSRLFIYYNERVRFGTVSVDSGAMIRDGIKSIAHEGVCPESMWPYEVQQFTAEPFRECYAMAEKFQVLDYARVPQDLVSMQACLASGLPFVFGFAVYENIVDSTIGGEVQMPKGVLIGGHAVLAVGYDDAKDHFMLRNSWGGWGDHGYGTIPYEYMTDSNLVDDLWTITRME